MADATATLQLDATGVERGAKQAEQAFNRVASADAKFRRQVSGKRIDDGLDQTTRRVQNLEKAQKGLFETERKVKNNLAGLVGDLSNVNTTGQAAAVTINRLTETMRIGFAASIGVGVGMAINQTITNAAASMDVLTDKWQELVNFDSRNAGDSALVQNLQKAVLLAKEANKESEKIAAAWVPGARDGFTNIADGAEASRKMISSSLVASAQRSAYDQELTQMGGEQIVGRRNLERQRDSAVASVNSMEGLDPDQKARMISAINAEFSSMIAQLMQKFAQATVAAVQKADQAVRASALAQESPLLDSREIAARRMRNQRDAANARYNTAFVNAGNRPYDLAAQADLRAAGAEKDEANTAVGMNRFTNAIDPATGRLRSDSARLSEVMARRRRRQSQLKSARQFAKDGGLLRVRRGSGGQAIGGIDPETGEGVGTASTSDLDRIRSSALNNPVSVGDSFGARSAMDSSLSLFGGVDGFKRSNGIAAEDATMRAMNAFGGGSSKSEDSKSLQTIVNLLQSLLTP